MGVVGPLDLVAALPADVSVAVVRDGLHTVVGIEPDACVAARGAAALEDLDGLGPGWWAGFAAYELGRAIETSRPAPPRQLPDLVLARFPARVAFAPHGGSRVEGRGPVRARLERLLDRLSPHELPPPRPLGAGVSGLSREEYERGVARVIEHLGAGDCYQANLTRVLEWPVAADPVALYASLCAQNPAPYLALIRLEGIAVVSASPECFLRLDGQRVETRPIKGTATDPQRLRESAKDRAENVMIVDMARNDFGRVCEPGSIHVPSLCAVERHPGLAHLVSTVRGTLRPGTGLGTLVAATFPPASVTGAPKPRVLDLIEDLEPVPRGVYCGALGWIDTTQRRADLAVAIRTFTIAGDRTSLGVGAGIVADSVPAAEWAETELKASRLLAAAGARDEPARLPVAS
jgi:para-aminobenzoate synthetase component I